MCPLRTYGNSPLCPTGHRPFGAAALLSLHFFSWSRQAGHRVPLTMCYPWMTHWAYCSCPNALVTFSSTAPAHPHATRVAVYPALFFFHVGVLSEAVEILPHPQVWRKAQVYTPPAGILIGADAKKSRCIPYEGSGTCSCRCSQKSRCAAVEGSQPPLFSSDDRIEWHRFTTIHILFGNENEIWMVCHLYMWYLFQFRIASLLYDATCKHSPQGNMQPAIPVVLLCMIVNLSERKQSSDPKGGEVL